MSDKARFPAQVWARSATIADPQLSPANDSTVAYVESGGGRVPSLMLRLAGSVPVALPCSPAVRPISASGGGAIGWAGPNAIVYVGSGGGVFRIDLDTLVCAPLQTRGDAIANTAVSPDGTRVAYVDDLADVYVSSTDCSVDATLRLSSGNDFAVDPAWSPDSSFVAWHEWDDPHMAWTQSRIVVRAADASDAIRVVQTASFVNQPRFVDSDSLGFISDASGWAVPEVARALHAGAEGESVDDVESGDDDAARALRAGAIEPLVTGSDANFEYCGATWGPGQRSWCMVANGVVAVRNNAGFGELVHIDNGSVRVLSHASATGLHAPTGSTRVAAITSGPVAPTRLEIFDVASGTSEVVAQSSQFGLETACVEPEVFDWTSTSDDMALHGRLYKPRNYNAETTPMLVWIHGGPTDQSLATITARVGYFVERGFSVLVPDYRGSTGWGTDYRNALNGGWGISDIDDVRDAIVSAIESGVVDSEKVIPYGGSAGGFATLMLLGRYPELCAGGIALYPLCDLAGFVEGTWRYEAHYVDSLIAPLPEAEKHFAERSPITYVDQICRPLLMIHGDRDKVVPLSQSHDFVASAQKAGVDVSFHVFEGEGHGWKSESAKMSELLLIEDFLREKKLLPEDARTK